MFKRVIHTKLNENILLSPHNSGFKKKFSITTLLIDITNKLYKAGERNKCSRIVFLNIFKAFDCVYHAGLFFKLKQLGIVDNCLQIILVIVVNMYLFVVSL